MKLDTEKVTDLWHLFSSFIKGNIVCCSFCVRFFPPWSAPLVLLLELLAYLSTIAFVPASDNDACRETVTVIVAQLPENVSCCVHLWLLPHLHSGRLRTAQTLPRDPLWKWDARWSCCLFNVFSWPVPTFQTLHAKNLISHHHHVVSISTFPGHRQLAAWPKTWSASWQNGGVLAPLFFFSSLACHFWQVRNHIQRVV